MRKSAICTLSVLWLFMPVANAGELTEEQCEEFRDWESLSLTDEQKKKVEDSCKSRYSSENAILNCTAFEGEDYIKELKERAKKEC